MDAARNLSACSSWILLVAVALAVCGCSAPRAHPPAARTPLSLTEPTTVSVNAVSLTVGTNRWPEDNALLAETFLPVAVTVHNASTRPVCGDVARAVLRDAAGASVSASSPHGVVERLLGPLARQDSSIRVTLSAAVPADDGARLLLIRGGHGGGMHFGPRYGPPAFGPSPYGVGTPHFFGSPFAAPGLPSSYNPYPYGSFPYSPFSSSLFPYSPYSYSPLPPFSSPFPPSYPQPYPLLPYGYAPSYPQPYPLLPYGYAVPPEARSYEKAPSADEHALMTQLFTLAFATQPLAAQEERSGFLFFPFPLPSDGPTLLDWGWYDCATRELVAQLSVPIAVPEQT